MPAKSNKIIVALPREPLTSSEVKSAQRSLGVKLTSSAELGGGVKAQDIYDAGRGLVFKNLQIAVLDADTVEEAKLARARNVLHFERERIYRPSFNPLATIAELRTSLGLMEEQLAALADELGKEITPPPTPNAQRFTWGLSAIGCGSATPRGKGVKVCVLDTGLDTGHPDFAERVIEGKSFIPAEDWRTDAAGHGTHTAGILCGDTSRENGIRYGLAPDVTLLIGKVLADNGDGTTGSLLDGMDWALEKGARVLSLSLGTPVGVGEAPSPVFDLVGDRAMSRGALIVAAAGNDSRRPRLMPRPVHNPANARSILAVSAVDRRRKVAKFSNAGINPGSGGRVDLAAPGVEVYSTGSRNAAEAEAYQSMNGTSMATPYVAAAAALYLERFPHLTASELWLRLEKDAQVLVGQAGRDVGAGLVWVGAL